MDFRLLFWTTVLFIIGGIQDVDAKLRACMGYSPTGRTIMHFCSACCGSPTYRYCCEGSQVPLIIGIVVGGVTLVGIVIGIVVCCYCGVCACCKTSYVTVSSSSKNPNVPNYYKSIDQLP